MPVDDPATIDDMGGSPFLVPQDMEERAERAQLGINEPLQAVRPSQMGMMPTEEDSSLDPNEWDGNPTEIAQSAEPPPARFTAADSGAVMSGPASPVSYLGLRSHPTTGCG